MVVGSISGQGGIKWCQPVHHNIYGANSLVHTVQLKSIIKAHSSQRMVSCDISDIVIASVHSEKTSLKKLMMMMKINITSNRKTIY